MKLTRAIDRSEGILGENRCQLAVNVVVKATRIVLLRLRYFVGEISISTLVLLLTASGPIVDAFSFYIIINGPCKGWLNAIEAYQACGKDLPINLKFCFEGMEESGSLRLADTVRSRTDFFGTEEKFLFTFI